MLNGYSLTRHNLRLKTTLYEEALHFLGVTNLINISQQLTDSLDVAIDALRQSYLSVLFDAP
jgi:hypothetical protein